MIDPLAQALKDEIWRTHVAMFGAEPSWEAAFWYAADAAARAKRTMSQGFVRADPPTEAPPPKVRVEPLLSAAEMKVAAE